MKISSMRQATTIATIAMLAGLLCTCNSRDTVPFGLAKQEMGQESAKSAEQRARLTRDWTQKSTVKPVQLEPFGAH